MRLFASLRNQTVLVLIVVLGLSHVISLAVYLIDRRSSLTEAESMHLAQRATDVAAVLERAPLGQRSSLVSARRCARTAAPSSRRFGIICWHNFPASIRKPYW